MKIYITIVLLVLTACKPENVESGGISSIGTRGEKQIEESLRDLASEELLTQLFARDGQFYVTVMNRGEQELTVGLNGDVIAPGDHATINHTGTIEIVDDQGKLLASVPNSMSQAGHGGYYTESINSEIYLDRSQLAFSISDNKLKLLGEKTVVVKSGREKYLGLPILPLADEAGLIELSSGKELSVGSTQPNQLYIIPIAFQHRDTWQATALIWSKP